MNMCTLVLMQLGEMNDISREHESNGRKSKKECTCVTKASNLRIAWSMGEQIALGRGQRLLVATVAPLP